jgi:hypothetical protein
VCLVSTLGFFLSSLMARKNPESLCKFETERKKERERICEISPSCLKSSWWDLPGKVEKHDKIRVGKPRWLECVLSGVAGISQIRKWTWLAKVISGSSVVSGQIFMYSRNGEIF